MLEKNKKRLFAWALYDFAVSSYSVVIFTFIYAAYFTNQVAPDVIKGTALWGFTISAEALLVALVGPFLGAIADFGGHHKKWLIGFTYLGVLTTSLLWFGYPDQSAIPLVLFCIFFSTFAFEVATIFYNTYLLKLAKKEYLGRISGWAWGFGYFGGLLCLITALIVFVDGGFSFGLGNDQKANIRAVPIFVSLWIVIFTLPFFSLIKDRKKEPITFKSAIKHGLSDMLATLKSLPSQKNLLLFLVARIVYIDGLNALLALGGIYAAGTFNFTLNDVAKFGIILNVAAGLGAGLFAVLDDWLGSKKTILLALLGLIIAYLIVLTVDSSRIFWIVAPGIGIFVGPIQAASRTMLTRLAKPDEITRMFGFYALTGKVTSFVGPFLVGVVTTYAHSQRVGMGVLIPFFIVGALLLLGVKENENR